MREINIFELDIVTRDNYLKRIENQIQSKRNLLLDKRRKLEKATEENQYLEKIKSNYQKYYDHIVEQKQEQIRAMQILQTYIDDIITSNKLTDKDMENTMKEQQQILEEIAKIKNSLDEIVDQKS
jgi:hypothetical protein